MHAGKVRRREDGDAGGDCGVESDAGASPGTATGPPSPSAVHGAGTGASRLAMMRRIVQDDVFARGLDGGRPPQGGPDRKRPRPADGPDARTLDAPAPTERPDADTVRAFHETTLAAHDADFVSRLLEALFLPGSRSFGGLDPDFRRACDAMAAADAIGRPDVWLPTPPRFFTQSINSHMLEDMRSTSARFETLFPDAAMQDPRRHLMHVTCYDAVVKGYSDAFRGFGGTASGGSYTPHVLALRALMARVQLGAVAAGVKFEAGFFDGVLSELFDAVLDADLSVREADDEARRLTDVLRKIIKDDQTKLVVVRQVEDSVRRSFELMSWGQQYDLEETLELVRGFYEELVFPLTGACQVRCGRNLGACAPPRPAAIGRVPDGRPRRAPRLTDGPSAPLPGPRAPACARTLSVEIRARQADGQHARRGPRVHREDAAGVPQRARQRQHRRFGAPIVPPRCG